MALGELTSRDAVLQAIAECDALGRASFLSKYGFGEAREYFLEFKQRSYDSKAIAGVAYGYQFPSKGTLMSSDFSGGYATVKRVLEGLGFSVQRR